MERSPAGHAKPGVSKMTVNQDLQKAMAAAKAAEGSYLVFAQATTEPDVRQMYQAMASDMARHSTELRGRLEYLNSHAVPQQAENQEKRRRPR